MCGNLWHVSEARHFAMCVPKTARNVRLKTVPACVSGEDKKTDANADEFFAAADGMTGKKKTPCG